MTRKISKAVCELAASQLTFTPIELGQLPLPAFRREMGLEDRAG